MYLDRFLCGSTNQIGKKTPEYHLFKYTLIKIIVFNRRSSKSTAMSFTDETIQMAISRATSELGYSALRPKQELAVGPFCESQEFMLLFAIQGLRFSPATDRVKRIYSLKPPMPWTA